MRASWHRSGLCRPASSSSPHVWPVCESFVTWIAQRGEETLPFMQHPWQVRALLVLKLLRIPSSALCPTRQVGTDTARRWQRFVLFFDSSEAEQRLKKVCLCLLMTDVALAIAAKKHDETRPGAHDSQAQSWRCAACSFQTATSYSREYARGQRH